MFCNNLLVHVLAPDGVCINTGLRCGLHAQSKARVRDDSFRQKFTFLLAQPRASLDLTVVIAFLTLRSGGSTAAQSAQDISVKSGVLRLQLSRQATAKLHHLVLHPSAVTSCSALMTFTHYCTGRGCSASPCRQLF